MAAGKLRIGVIFGGQSGEHPISIRSSRYVVDSLDRKRFELVLIGIDRDGGWHLLSEAAYRVVDQDVPVSSELVVPLGRAGRCALLSPRHPDATVADVDVMFPILHGSFGEDGTIQGLLEMLGVPYVGVGVLGAAVCMDKDVCKRLLREADIPVVSGEVVSARIWAQARERVRAAAARLGCPLFVKPASLGSSLGVSKVTELDDLDAAVTRALAMDGKLLIERGIEGRELEVAVLGNEEIETSVPGEIIPGEAFYSYDDKYAATSQAHLLIPAPLTDRQTAEARDLARRTFAALGCTGMARVDLFLERSTERFYVNEVNTIPGFTSISMYPKLWAASGLPGPALVTRLIELALERHASRRALDAHAR